MKTVLWTVLGTIAGLAVGFALTIGVELFDAVVHPFPADFDYDSMEAMCGHVENYPGWVLAVVVPMWAGTAFAAASTARFAGSLIAAGIVGALILVAIVSNQWMLPYPVWFEIANLMATPAAILFALRPPGKVAGKTGDDESSSHRT